MKNIKGYIQMLNEQEGQDELNKELLDAVKKESQKMVKGLLDRGARVDAVDGSGRTPLHRAALWNRTGLARLLMTRGAEVDAVDLHGYTPLLLAAYWSKIDMVRLLLDLGAAVDAVNVDGQTPLTQAAISGKTDVARLLILRGADPFKAFDDPQKTLTLLFNGDIDWMPVDLKRRLQLIQRSKKMFGM